jgi:proteasome assembly chaperone 3
MTAPDVREDDFPAPSRETAGTVGDVPTQITRLDFSDKILLTISQRGRLSQWVRPPFSLLVLLKERAKPQPQTWY